MCSLMISKIYTSATFYCYVDVSMGYGERCEPNNFLNCCYGLWFEALQIFGLDESI